MSWRVLTLLAATIALALAPAASALAHGEEEEALAEMPARTLAQQALGLLTQADQPLEAHERLEAALESENQGRVLIPALRDAMRALDRGDHDEAVEHINEALAPAEDPAEPAAEVPDAEALAHTEEFEPESGTEEWIGLGLGGVLILVALGLLATRRRPGSGVTPRT
jgi:hypothetical protein